MLPAEASSGADAPALYVESNFPEGKFDSRFTIFNAEASSVAYNPCSDPEWCQLQEPLLFKGSTPSGFKRLGGVAALLRLRVIIRQPNRYVCLPFLRCPAHPVDW